MVGGLVWGIGLRRLGCVCGRRLGTGSGVSVRQTTNLVVRGLGRAFLCLSVCRPTGWAAQAGHTGLDFDRGPGRCRVWAASHARRACAETELCPESELGAVEVEACAGLKEEAGDATAAAVATVVTMHAW